MLNAAVCAVRVMPCVMFVAVSCAGLLFALACFGIVVFGILAPSANSSDAIPSRATRRPRPWGCGLKIPRNYHATRYAYASAVEPSIYSLTTTIYTLATL